MRKEEAPYRHEALDSGNSNPKTGGPLGREEALVRIRGIGREEAPLYRQEAFWEKRRPFLYRSEALSEKRRSSRRKGGPYANQRPSVKGGGPLHISEVF